MDIELQYHTTKEIFGLHIADDDYLIEVERLDPRLHPLKDCVELVGTALFKIVDGERIPFDNKIFINEIIPYLVKHEPAVMMKNILFWDRIRYFFMKLKNGGLA